MLTAVHQNATPVPADSTVRTRRCEVNLRAAEVAAQAADYPQALTFLDAAEGLLSPQLFADHARGMRLTYQRARIFGAMLRHAESLRFAQQAIRHARDLIEEGQALLLAIGALTGLRRYDEALEACVDFCSRLAPQAKLPNDVPLEARGRCLFVVENYIRHLDEPLRRTPPLLLAAASCCQQARDLTFTGYALAIRGGALDFLGDPIEQLNALQVQLTREPAVAASPEIPDWLCLLQGLRDALQGHKDAAVPPPAESAGSRTVGGLRSAVRLRGAALGVWPGPYRGAEQRRSLSRPRFEPAPVITPPTTPTASPCSTPSSCATGAGLRAPCRCTNEPRAWPRKTAG